MRGKIMAVAGLAALVLNTSCANNPKISTPDTSNYQFSDKPYNSVARFIEFAKELEGKLPGTRESKFHKASYRTENYHLMHYIDGEIVDLSPGQDFYFSRETYLDENQVKKNRERNPLKWPEVKGTRLDYHASSDGKISNFRPSIVYFPPPEGLDFSTHFASVEPTDKTQHDLEKGLTDFMKLLRGIVEQTKK